MRLAWLLLLIPLAGCLGGDAPSSGDARSAYALSQGAVDARYEYQLFLGITGMEGDLDWDAYEADQRRQGGASERLADAFDQDVADDRFGDGDLGAWMTTHFAYDQERRLVGGLFTQVLRDGSRSAILAPFSGPYAGAASAVSTGHRLAADGLHDALAPALEAQEADPVLCTLHTDVTGWNITSNEAAQIALATPEMQRHLETYPAGELSYFYFPRLSVESSCPEELDAPSNHWTLMHTDLDTYLAGTIPTVAKVVVDAGDGTIREASIGPLSIQAPQLLDDTVHIKDPWIPRDQQHILEVEVGDRATLLEWQVYRTEHPEQVYNSRLTLTDPEGRMLDARAFDVPLHRFVLNDPMPGTWRVEYSYQPLVPAGEHVLEVRGAIVYG